MDPRTNPYAPGAGTPPPELAGREAIIEMAAISLDRIRAALVARSVMLVGLRGVGKTVLLNRMHNDAEAMGFATVMLEAPERRSLPALLAPAVRAALLKLDRMAAGGDLAKRAMRALGGFVQAMKLKFGDIEFGLDLGLEPGVADTGDLDADLVSLFRAVGEAARERQTVMVLFIDELQYVAEPQLAALITALHRCAQLQLPVTLIGAGLPQLVGRMGKAKSYAERLFEFTDIGPLPEAAARQAITAPREPLRGSIQRSGTGGNHASNQGLPLLPARVGETQLGLCNGVADRVGGCPTGHHPGLGRPGCQLFPRAAGPPHALGETLFARHGRAWARPAPIR